MAFQSTQTVDRRPGVAPGFDETALKNLSILLEINAENAREKARFRSDKERREAEALRRPLDPKKAFSYFGLMLGVLPPATIFTSFAVETDVLRNGVWVIGILLIMNLLSAVVGFFSGRWIGRMVAGLEKMSWTKMIVLLPFVGILWGFMAGGASGFVVFGFGAIFGAIIGGMVGAVALTAFGIFHRLLQRGRLIEAKHFLPLALGVTFCICSFILGQF